MPATPQQGSVAPVSRSIGIHGGLNLADLVGGDAGDSESGVGLNAGASFQLLRLGPVSLGPEVFYAQKRSERVAALSGLSSPVASRFNLAYVEVPLLLRIHLPRFAGGRLAPHVHGGPVFGWNLDCDIDFADRDARPEDTCSSLLGGDARSTLEDYEQGVTVGAGMNVVVVPGRGALSLDLRTTRGLSDVIETSEGPDLEIRNRTFSALLGYSFGL
jgi:hypothetical protein